MYISNLVTGNCKPLTGECTTNSCSFDQGTSYAWCNTENGYSNCECDYNLLELNEWKSYYGFYQLFILNLEYYEDDSYLVRLSKHKELDWTTPAVGSFFIKNMDNIKNKCGKEWIPKINKLFTLPQQNLSLPHIAFMHAANDFQTYPITSGAQSFTSFTRNKQSFQQEDFLKIIVPF